MTDRHDYIVLSQPRRSCMRIALFRCWTWQPMSSYFGRRGNRYRFLADYPAGQPIANSTGTA